MVALTVMIATTACGSSDEAVDSRPDRPATDSITAPSTNAPSTTAPSTTAPSTTAPSTTTPSTTAPSTTARPAPLVGTALFAGDSVARGEAPAVVASLAAAGVIASSMAFDGAGILAEPEHPLDKYVNGLEQFGPDLVLYQLSVWDRGSPDEQAAVYRSFADLVAARGAQLVFITPPPFERAEEYAHMASLSVIAAELARERPETIHLLDASPVWGTTFTRDLGADGVTDRMPDGVHVCQGGAFRFAVWLVGELALRFDGITVPTIEEWIFGEWNASAAYDTPPGACDPLEGP